MTRHAKKKNYSIKFKILQQLNGVYWLDISAISDRLGINRELIRELLIECLRLGIVGYKVDSLGVVSFKLSLLGKSYFSQL